jgi:hypothetical protein
MLVFGGGEWLIPFLVHCTGKLNFEEGAKNVYFIKKTDGSV